MFGILVLLCVFNTKLVRASPERNMSRLQRLLSSWTVSGRPADGTEVFSTETLVEKIITSHSFLDKKSEAIELQTR